MKKTLAFITATFVIFMTTSCMRMHNYTNMDDKDNDIFTEDNNVSLDSNNHIIQIHYIEAPDNNEQLSNDQAEYVISVWNNSEWAPDVAKTICLYQFKYNEFIIRYSSEAGVFIDDTNQRSLIITDEQRVFINSYIISQIVLRDETTTGDNSTETTAPQDTSKLPNSEYFDYDCLHKPTYEEVMSIADGMHISEVIDILGKPHDTTHFSSPYAPFGFVWVAQDEKVYIISLDRSEGAPEGDLSTVEWFTYGEVIGGAFTLE